MSKLFSTQTNGDSLPYSWEIPVTWQEREHSFVLVSHKNMLDSPTELPNKCTHKLWGENIGIIIKLRPDGALAVMFSHVNTCY